VTFWAAWEGAQGPIGPDRLDYLAGTIASSQVNLWRKKGEQVGRMDLIEDWGGLRAEAEKRAQAEGMRKSHDRMVAWGETHGLDLAED
jgi:hypothetical protein